jgi:hypothetical protein
VCLDADRKVVHDADAHPGLRRGALRRLELFVAQPLQPAMEPDPFGQPGLVRAGERPAGARRFDGPLGRIRGVELGERAPQGEVGELPALAGPVGLELLLSGSAAGHHEEFAEGGQFGGVARVAVERFGVAVRGAERGRERLHAGAGRCRQVGVFGHVLDPEIERVEEAPARGQVRRGFDGRRRFGGVQRVDQHESGAEAGAADRGEVGEVGEVADAPGPFGPHRVQLGHQAPGPALGEHGRVLEPARRDDEGDGCRAAVGFGVQRMPAQGQRVRHAEDPPADRDAVDVLGVPPLVLLGQLVPGSVVRHDPDGDGHPLAGVHEERGLRSLPQHDDGRQQEPPGREFVLAPGGAHLGDRVGGHAERAEHTAQRLEADGPLRAVGPVPGIDPVGFGQGGEFPDRLPGPRFG